jgi:hypothetical protein
MRKLHKLIVTAAGAVTVGAVALSLIPASAVAAESNEDCYARLNAIRAQAGSPAASATDLPALAQAAAYRAEAGANGHTDQSQHHQTPGRDGFTGATSWDRTKAAGLQDGTWRGQFENVTTTTGTLDGAAPAGRRRPPGWWPWSAAASGPAPGR